MPRQVITRKDIINEHQKNLKTINKENAPVEAKRADKYRDRLLKYIPAEIVAVYIFVQGAIHKLDSQSSEYAPIFWIVFGIFCLFTPLYLWRIQKVRKITQLIISLIAFVIWVFALGGPFALLPWYDPVYGEILLPVYTLGIAIIGAETMH